MEQGGEAGDNPEDLRNRRDGKHRCYAACHTTEPVIRMPQTGTSRGLTAKAVKEEVVASHTRRLRARGGVAGPVRQDDDGKRNPQGSSRNRQRLKKYLLRLLSLPTGLAVEKRFGLINTLSEPIEWLTDNASLYIASTPHACSATSAWTCARAGTQPIIEGCGRGIKTLKRPRFAEPRPRCRYRHGPTAFWFEHYYDLNPHSASGYQSPREFISSQSQT